MQFDLKVYRAEGGVSLLRSSAHDAQSARDQAERQGYAVLSARAVRNGLFGGGGRVRFDVPLFGQELLALMEAGMGLVEALSLLAERVRQAEVKQVLSHVLSLVAQGQPFSCALEGNPDIFPVLFVASVRASEKTGNLVEGVKRYLTYHGQVNALRAKVISASIYPVLLLAVGGLVVLFLMVYVVPRFSQVYAGLGEERLPFLSLLLMRWGQLASEFAMPLVIVAAGMVAVGVYLVRMAFVRAWLERWLWRIPGVGAQLQIYQLARFTRTVAMLLKGGIPLLSALDMTDALLRQPVLKAGLMAARQALREGYSLAETFREQGLATEVGVRLLVVGERGGELGETMERIAAFYDDETARYVEWFTKLFEPVLMVFMGLLIGGIVILMYLPIFQLASSIQ